MSTNPYTPDIEKLYEVHTWSKDNVADYHPTDNFIETPTHRLIVDHLTHSRPGVTYIKSPQGMGKTQTQIWLTEVLDGGLKPPHKRTLKVVVRKGTKIMDVVSKFRKRTRTISKEVRLDKEVPLTKEERESPYNVSGKNTKTVYYDDTEYSLESYFGEDPDYILIDFEDYSMTHLQRPNADITDLQTFIYGMSHPPLGENTLERNEDVVLLQSKIIIFYQAELWEKIKHFIRGKPKVFDLVGFEPKELVAHYRRIWGNPHLFTDDALFELAEMSRGIMRWYLKYIDLCLDQQKMKLINDDYDLKTQTVEDIYTIISPSQIVREWQNEFTVLYPRSKENQLKAELIMRYIKSNGPTPQSILRKTFFEPEKAGKTACSRMLTKMEDAGAITRTTIGREKYVELA